MDGPTAPEKYRINQRSEVTILLYQRQKVVASYGFAKDALTEKSVETILTAAAKLVDKSPRE